MPLSPLAALSTRCASTALCYLRSVSLWGVVIVLFLFGLLRARAASVFEPRLKQPTSASATTNATTAMLPPTQATKTNKKKDT
ncbi:hypothetical protein PG985_011017 [Apiospora marii]|uniref:uncharacterized protein n=1 Tax=Apiospora marii TaxID=335849 RepID=UPI0031320002